VLIASPYVELIFKYSVGDTLEEFDCNSYIITHSHLYLRSLVASQCSVKLSQRRWLITCVGNGSLLVPFTCPCHMQIASRCRSRVSALSISIFTLQTIYLILSSMASAAWIVTTVYSPERSLEISRSYLEWPIHPYTNSHPCYALFYPLLRSPRRLSPPDFHCI
jgi:hypothetical protein